MLFVEESFMQPSDTAKRLLQKIGGGTYHVLNFYEFHMLIHATRDQNTNYHSLDDTFFDRLSEHKKKMCFYGYLENGSFTPMEVLYDLPYGKLGIYVRKNIVKSFKDNEIEIALMAKDNKSNLTRFVIL